MYRYGHPAAGRDAKDGATPQGREYQSLPLRRGRPTSGDPRMETPSRGADPVRAQIPSEAIKPNGLYTVRPVKARHLPEIAP